MDIQALLKDDLVKAEAELKRRGDALMDTLRQKDQFVAQANETLQRMNTQAEEQNRQLLRQDERVTTLKEMLARVTEAKPEGPKAVAKPAKLA